MLGHSAILIFRLLDQPKGELRIQLSIVPFVTPAHPCQKLDVFANNRLVLRQTFEHAGSSDVRFVIPRHLIGPNGVVQLDLNSADPVSPAALGLSSDVRELSIGVTQLNIDDATD
jgi:hypothetical protein